MAEGGALLKRYTPKGVSRVRIPPSPPANCVDCPGVDNCPNIVLGRVSAVDTVPGNATSADTVAKITCREYNVQASPDRTQHQALQSQDCRLPEQYPIARRGPAGRRHKVPSMSRWGERSDRETRSIAAKHDALKIQHLRFAESNHPAHATTRLRPAVALICCRLKFSV